MDVVENGNLHDQKWIPPGHAPSKSHPEVQRLHQTPGYPDPVTYMDTRSRDNAYGRRFAIAVGTTPKRQTTKEGMLL